MIYDFSLLQESPAFMRLLIAIALGFSYLLLSFYLKNKLIKYKFVVFNTVVVLFIVGIGSSYFGVDKRNKELKSLQEQYNKGSYEILKGELAVDRSYKNSGLDKFAVGESEFLRITPHKQVPKYGCWTGFINEIDWEDGIDIRIEYINFERWKKPPFIYGVEKIDQICILKLESIFLDI